jgi:ParB family chromosome partitioning protein
MPEFQKGRLYRLDVADLLPDPSQPRQTIDDERLEDLSLSIRKHGVLEPVLFRQAETGQLFVVAGSRRLEATRRARLTKIPAILAEGDAAEIALVENLVRQDLTSIEEAEAIEALKFRHNYTLAELSSILGKSVPTISEITSLTRLPLSIRDECRSDHNIARSILVEIVKLDSEQDMLAIYARYKSEGLSRSALRKRESSASKKSPGYTRLFRSFSKQVSRIDVSTLADKERIKVKKELESLKRIIEENLAKLHE